MHLRAVRWLLCSLRLCYTDLRTVPIPNTHDADGVAEFITGDDVLRPFTTELEAGKYPDSFAEATEIRILRRGRLACMRGAGNTCRLLLASAETVRTDD